MMRRSSTEGMRRRGWLVRCDRGGGAAGLRRHRAGGPPVLGRGGPHTLERVITGADPGNGYATLSSQALNTLLRRARRRGEGNPLIPNAQPGRADRRRSLAYVGQLTDFQLADEESPARVEFTDQEPTGFAASAWRPQEALQPFIIDWSIRQMNLFARREPRGAGRRRPRGDGLRADHRRPGGQHAAQRDALDPAAARGRDVARPQQRQPEPGRLGSADAPELRGLPAERGEPRRGGASTRACRTTTTTTEGLNPYFYDPDDPHGAWAQQAGRAYPGLMDRAQLPFTPAGLDVPSYVTNGNHDGLVQGNQGANAAFEDIATGCFKALGSTSSPLTGPAAGRARPVACC